MERYPNPLTPKSLQALMRDERYLNRFHPDHETYFRFIEEGFKRLYPGHMDESALAGGPGPVSSTVHVRAYTQSRDGDIVSVLEHYRSAPGTGLGGDGAAERSIALKTRNPLPFKPAIRNDGAGYGDYDANRESGGKKYRHQAIDLEAPPGTEARSPIGGTIKVRKTYKDERYGGEFTTVWIKDEKGNEYGFGYVSPIDNNGRLLAKDGDRVKAGDIIGFVQDRAKYDPKMRNHIHFAIKDKNGNPVNPTSMVEGWRNE